MIITKTFDIRGNQIELLHPVKVDKIIIPESFDLMDDNGELKAIYNGDIPVMVHVDYDRIFFSGKTKVFSMDIVISDLHRIFSLSAAPWSHISGDYVTNVTITVTYNAIKE